MFTGLTANKTDGSGVVTDEQMVSGFFSFSALVALGVGND